MAVDWSFYDDYEYINDEYLPDYGEGDNFASQLVTAVTKLVYKWYNDGDVYDNTHRLEGWANDLSDYANWIYKYASKYEPSVKRILDGIDECYNDDDYEELLKNLTLAVFEDEFLKELSSMPKEGSIYNCDGPFEFSEYSEDEDDDYWDEEDEEDEDW